MDSDFDEAFQKDIDQQVQRTLDSIFPVGEIIVLRSVADVDKFFRNKMQEPHQSSR